jgi:hypothetical protein
VDDDVSLAAVCGKLLGVVVDKVPLLDGGTLLWGGYILEARAY